jgi:hypothetical protein
LSLGVDPKVCHLELNTKESVELLKSKGIIALEDKPQ